MTSFLAFPAKLQTLKGKRHKFWKQAQIVLKYVILILAVGLALFPTLWMLSTSIKIPQQYFSNPPVWLPTQPTVEHYFALFLNYEGGEHFKNSIIIAVASTFLTLTLSIPAAYAIARHNVGGDRFSFWILSQRMLPPVAAVIPLFLLYVRLRLIDTFTGIILAHTIFNIPFAVWILIGFFADFPRDIQDQALVDGCTEFESLWRIVLPIVLPGVVVVALFSFVFSWNEVMFALTIGRTETRTITKLFESLLQSPTGVFFGPAAAAVVLGIIPAYVLTLFFQRYLVRGLTLGSVRG
ncbi:MAG: carbohydrate ABC transporter permease [Chloroflexota bacterium]